MSLKASRFALLKDEYEEEKNKSQEPPVQNKAKPKKKKNKKKAATDTPAAAGLSDEWIAKDSEILDQNYERDMEEAILQSQLELEKRKTEVTEGATSGGHPNNHHRGAEAEVEDEDVSKAVKSKTRNKNRARGGPQTISLEEFQNTAERKKSESSETTSHHHHHQNSSKDSGGDASQLFEDAHNKAKRLVKLEKDKEAYDRQFKVDAVLRSRYTEQLEEKDRIIAVKEEETESMQQMIEALRIELQDKEKCNKKLENLLSQGKLREVRDLLKEVEDLCQVRDDLTSQLTETTAELERERSKNHQNKSELDRIKSQKHGGATTSSK